MSVAVKSGVRGLVSADKYNLIAMSDYDKIGRFLVVLGHGVVDLGRGLGYI